MPPNATAADALLDQLASVILDRMGKGTGKKGATGTPTTYYAHGPTGLFSTAGVGQDVISTVVQPQGLIGALPAYPTVYMNPLYQYVTGFLADVGAEAATVCDNCKTAGIKKGCLQTAQFGRYCRETRELSVERVAQRINLAEPDNLRMVNPLFGADSWTPQLARQDPFRSEMAQALLEVGVSFQQLLTPQLWTGNPANNNVGGGYAEFPGLSILVGTSKVDALSGVECPSLDSDVKDYNYQDVCEGSPSIVEALSYLYRYVSKNARTMNCDPVDFRFAMREELFYELTSCWPCSYMSFRCTSLSADVLAQISGEAAIRLRDDMRNGRYLIVDGKQIPVILDDGIPETTPVNDAHLNPGEFASDIYLLPFSMRGGFATLYMEFFDFSKAATDISLGKMQDVYDVTDGGKFLWIRDWVRGCFLLQAVVRPRVVLLTPHLAGRLQHVKYSPLQHTREPFIGDPYHIDGGATTRAATTLYSDWNLPS